MYLVSRVWLSVTPDCSLSGSSIQEILQTRILEEVAISFSRGSSLPRDWICVSCIIVEFFTAKPQRKLPPGQIGMSHDLNPVSKIEMIQIWSAVPMETELLETHSYFYSILLWSPCRAPVFSLYPATAEGWQKYCAASYSLNRQLWCPLSSLGEKWLQTSDLSL